MLNLITKDRETGFVKNKGRPPGMLAQNYGIEVSVLGLVAINLTLSTRKLAIESDDARTDVQRILKNLHPYKST